MSEDVYTRPYPTTHTYDSLRVHRPDRGTQQNAVQRNTAQHGDSNERKNCSRAAAGCLGTLCLLLLAAIIGLVIHNSDLVKQTRHNLAEEKAKFQTSLDELQTRNINLTEETDDLKKRLCELPGWKKLASSYYYISTEKKNWEDSRQYCKDNQSDLMVINSKEKQDFVVRLNWRVWLGLTDREIEATWKWVDGTRLTTPTYWTFPEPNNKGDPPNTEEDCAEFFNPNPRVKEHGTWNDRSCTALNHWICERVIY